MRFLHLVWLQMKRIAKTPTLLISIIVMPVVVNFGVILLNNNSDFSASNYVIQVDDTGDRWQDVIAEEFAASVSEEGSLDSHFERMDNGEIAAIYHVPANFSNQLATGENPEIIRYTRAGNAGDVLFENSIQESIKNVKVTETLMTHGLLAEGRGIPQAEDTEARLLFQTQELDGNFASIIILLIFYILMNASFISGDMISFKKNNVLQRMIISPNKDIALVTSMIIAYTIFLFSTNVLILFVSQIVLGFTTSQLPLVVCLLAVTCILSLSFAFALFRLLKNEGLAQFIGMFYSIGSFLVTMLVQTGVESRALQIVSMFTPIHWVLEALDRNRFFPHVLILLLMAAVFITAGSYKLKDFVKQ